MPPATVRVQTGSFDMAAEVTRLKSSPNVGAVVTFTGVCRDEGGRLAALELEHYPGMAEVEIGRIADEAGERWPLAGVTIIHRTGTIAVGEDIVLVATASAHRDAAFAAASFIMDFLKTRAPFWKREQPAGSGAGNWIAAHEIDTAAEKRWTKKG